jgi:molecular chaperone GrpE
VSASDAGTSPFDPTGGVPADDAVTSDATGADTVAADRAAADESAEAVEVDIERLLAEREQFRDIALRLQADFENFRKRADKLRIDEVDRATGRMVEDLLPVLDACELAYAHGVQGIEGVWSGLLGALRKYGLEPMDSADKPFDPAHHEAVVHEPGEGGDPVVSEVLRTGYTWKGKVLRPAMVKVKG